MRGGKSIPVCRAGLLAQLIEPRRALREGGTPETYNSHAPTTIVAVSEDRALTVETDVPPSLQPAVQAKLAEAVHARVAERLAVAFPDVFHGALYGRLPDGKVFLV